MISSGFSGCVIVRTTSCGQEEDQLAQALFCVFLLLWVLVKGVASQASVCSATASQHNRPIGAATDAQRLQKTCTPAAHLDTVVGRVARHPVLLAVEQLLLGLGGQQLGADAGPVVGVSAKSG